MKHKRFGGSTAERTHECPGWHKLADTLPPQEETVFAATGACLHAAIDELVNDTELTPTDMIGKVFHGVEVTQELAYEKLAPALNAWARVSGQYTIDEYETEVPVNLPDYPDIGGTADLLGASAHVALVLDWKFGDGVVVPVENSHQGRHYAMCAAGTDGVSDLFADRERVVIAIIQPILGAAEDYDPLKIWETTPDAIAEFKEDYLEAVEEAKETETADAQYLLAGDWCRFCPAKAICPLKTGLVAQQQKLPVESLIPGQISTALHLAAELEDWIAGVRKFAHEQMERGDRFDGFKLVNKRASRKWSDAEAVEAKVHKMRKIKDDDAFTETLLSPAQLEKLCKAKNVDFKQFANYISSISSGTTIAPASDPRPEAPAIQALKALAAQVA